MIIEMIWYTKDFSKRGQKVITQMALSDLLISVEGHSDEMNESNVILSCQSKKIVVPR